MIFQFKTYPLQLFEKEREKKTREKKNVNKLNQTTNI